MKIKKLVITTLTGAGLAIAAVGCGVATGNGQPAPASKESVATQTVAAGTIIVNAGKTAMRSVTVKAGGTVRISLPGNSSTGFDWQVAQGAAGYLKQVGEPTFKAESSLDGAPGMLTYTFKALKTGDTVLVMKYSQPWENDQPAAETVAFAVHVIADGDSPDVSVTLKKATASITLKEGQSLDIALPANPSTGYSWTLVRRKGNVLAAIGEATYKAESDLMGAPGVSTLHFKAETAGAEMLVLGYQGPGSAGTVDGAYALSVIVK